MYPCFYKHCVIFDMDLHDEDWFEITLVPVFMFLRKILAFVEFIALGYYQYYLMELNDLNCLMVIQESILMMLGLICLNKLNLDIYEIYNQGWRDVDFKLHGIYQVINMISPNPPE